MITTALVCVRCAPRGFTPASSGSRCRIVAGSAIMHVGSLLLGRLPPRASNLVKRTALCDQQYGTTLRRRLTWPSSLARPREESGSWTVGEGSAPQRGALDCSDQQHRCQHRSRQWAFALMLRGFHRPPSEESRLGGFCTLSRRRGTMTPYALLLWWSYGTSAVISAWRLRVSMRK